MAGPKLEVVKFGFYVFFPVGVMLYFGGPDFYDKYVKGLKFWPDYDTTYQPPKTSEEVRGALDRMKAEREERWRKAYQARQQQQQSETQNNEKSL
ncbi:uncharacterized protein BYT42DRAFT_56110 [Radiomyces spectabilis]|uniref:uncharacterized protein n=1 Tax=Radiomyces spectabilis TaxID=64574 RepID=UPI002220EB8E|nr:uncharacterized protein BYT42DRAFT_56110 [Radiomyces spectabilis]KAI8373032.1 hypothetical protein BYT42DRAFT_56110 [Radiomyces spectabilis]